MVYVISAMSWHSIFSSDFDKFCTKSCLKIENVIVNEIIPLCSNLSFAKSKKAAWLMLTYVACHFSRAKAGYVTCIKADGVCGLFAARAFFA